MFDEHTVLETVNGEQSIVFIKKEMDELYLIIMIKMQIE
jgi:hypothetical protein